VKLLLDTSTLIDILRGERRVVDRFRSADPGTLMISAVSAGELLSGAAQSHDAQRELMAVDLLIRPLSTAPLDTATARRAGILDAMLRRAGTPIGAADRLIAATALEHEAVVVTSDTRDFLRVPFLTTEDWRTA
jgi:tRNA(fMet)-specific endonuclease VapC